MDKIGIKFTYYRMGTSISRMTAFENMEDVVNRGLENVAEECIKEVVEALGLDLNQLSYPYPASRFCFFTELSFDSGLEVTTESKRITVVNDTVAVSV
ncbi:hypothetical protein P4V41_03195 [Fictibacillus nanhaiensis]|uniref:hypothetical protein n=1 Tax=Fictibacillus nanhaiensis TaxID=742169 RepID=UPI002E2187F8|nr:hypothetical protein [Fictibacillus nanhaiensis]